MRALEAGTSIEKKAPQKAEVVLGLLAGDVRHGQLQMPADDLGDLPHRNALIADRLQACACGRFLQCQPEQARSVQPMDGRPAIGPVARVRRNATGPRDSDQAWHEAMIATLCAALAEALRGRGVADPAAKLTAQVGMAVFITAFERWVEQSNPQDLPALIRESLDALRSLAASERRSAPVSVQL